MRIAIGIEYDGTAYNGWQRQRTGTGVQTLVEAAVSSVADEAVELVCAGRTDAGVHASGQVAHFDTTASRTEQGWVLGINCNLPDDINASWARQVDDDFHARFSATARHYHYRILNRQVRSSLNRHRAWWVYQSLNENSMRAASECLIGEHDFSAFRAAGCQASTPTRVVRSLAIERTGDCISLDICANAFLQYMVRNITGTLAAVGRGEQPPEWMAQVLESRDRKEGGIAAPAHGLTLVAVDYPGRYEIPSGPEITSAP